MTSVDKAEAEGQCNTATTIQAPLSFQVIISACSQVVQQYVTKTYLPHLLQESMSRSLLNRYLDDLIQKRAAAPKKHDF